MRNIIGASKYLIVLSVILVVASAFFLFKGGLKLGIDFKGGSLMQLSFQADRPGASEIQNSLKELSLGDITPQPVKDKEMIIRMKEVDNTKKQEILDKLKKDFGAVDEISFETVGPTIGKELQGRSVTAVIIVMVAIIIYISLAFRKVSLGPVPSYVYGLGAVIALLHDLIVVIGVFAVLGYYFNVEIGLLFVTALLTVLGFSVHDTIVVYDRIRERLHLVHQKSFKEIINESINSTLVRSLNTSLTTLFVLTALYLFGGETIKYFILALIVGIIVGTYSSIFIASPFVLAWEKFSSRR